MEVILHFLVRVLDVVSIFFADILPPNLVIGGQGGLWVNIISNDRVIICGATPGNLCGDRVKWDGVHEADPSVFPGGIHYTHGRTTKASYSQKSTESATVMSAL